MLNLWICKKNRSQNTWKYLSLSKHSFWNKYFQENIPSSFMEQYNLFHTKLSLFQENQIICPRGCVINFSPDFYERAQTHAFQTASYDCLGMICVWFRNTTHLIPGKRACNTHLQDVTTITERMILQAMKQNDAWWLTRIEKQKKLW